MTLKTYATANAPFSAKKSPSRIPYSTIMVESGERTGDVRQGRAKPADLLVTAFTGATGGGARGQKSHPCMAPAGRRFEPRCPMDAPLI